MLDQMQVPSEQKVTDSLMPIPSHFPFGHVTITVDHEEFIAAIGYGMMSYFEAGDDKKTQMSAQELLNDLKETLDEDTSPRYWSIGFLVGQIAGFLNPDLKEDDPSLSYLESLARKCQRLYC